MLLPILFLLVACGTTPRQVDTSSCTEVRAAFDVGSGTTKLTVAEVDTCRNRVNEVLFEKEQAVTYNEALERPESDSKPKLPDSIIREGKQVLAKLKKQANAHDPDAYSGIATSVFRKASNGKQAVNRLSRSSGIPIRLISQNMEARLGLIGASPHAENPDGSIAVWDIGAGSMQLTVRSENQDPKYYRGDLGSIPFKRKVIRLKGNDPDIVSSPNPLGFLHAIQAYTLALSYAARDVPPEIQSALGQLEQPVIGIGGVHQYSIRPQVVDGDAQQYAHSGVVQTLMERSLMDDEDIGGEYASTEVINLAMVGGMMDWLQIDQIRVASVNLSDGLLLADDAWNSEHRGKN